MTDDARLRAVEQGLAVHVAECGMRQREILSEIQELREDGRGRDGQLRGIAMGVWSAVSALGALLGWTWWPSVASAFQRMAGG